MAYQAVLYFDGPLSRWKQVQAQIAKGQFTHKASPAPDIREVLCQKEFRWQAVAEGWAIAKTRGLDNVLYQIREL